MNPILPLDKCIADGEAHVFDNRVYIFGSHDKVGGESYCMENYEFFSSPLSHFSSFTSKGINYKAGKDPGYKEGSEYLFAPDVVRGNDGKYYLYYALAGWKGKGGYSHPIAVAVSSTPDGEYSFHGYVKNKDGTVFDEYVCFDPALINDEGRIFLYFGSGPFRNMRCKGAKKYLLAFVYSKVFGKSFSSFLSSPGPLGANVVELEEDMVTIKERPRRILGEDYGMHSFFEGSSIRKVRDKYFFVYSSSLNHELCYAISDYPDRDFTYMGTIISNGDVGYKGRKEKDRINATGTIHGSIEKIGEDWYVFYHRLTSGSDYSRQMCAERIEISSTYQIHQVPMTSSGWDDSLGKGRYSAAICCGLRRGRMPHLSNRKIKGIPMIVKKGEDWILSGLKKNTVVLYRFFDLSSSYCFSLSGRGKGSVEVRVDGKKKGELSFGNIQWEERNFSGLNGTQKSEIEIVVTKGSVELLEFSIF